MPGQAWSQGGVKRGQDAGLDEVLARNEGRVSLSPQAELGCSMLRECKVCATATQWHPHARNHTQVETYAFDCAELHWDLA